MPLVRLSRGGLYMTLDTRHVLVARTMIYDHPVEG
jgi:hypothetical protein